jgi:hypothetical protein
MTILASILILLASTTSLSRAQLDQTVYYIYQSQGTDCNGEHAVAVRGQVLDNSFSLQRASNNDGTSSSSCVEETFCLLNADSEQCLTLTGGLVNNAQVSVSYTDQEGVIDNGGQEQLLECDTSNSDIGQPLCIFDPPPCSASGSYPSCTYTLVTGTELVADPTVLYNANPPSQIKQTAYSVFYSDDLCTELAAMQGIVLNTNYTVRAVPDTTVSCEESLACMLNPTGPSCADVSKDSPGEDVTGFLQQGKGGDTFEYCIDAKTCEPVATTCTQSTVYPNCYRYAQECGCCLCSF